MKALIFDFDGVIVDSVEDIFQNALEAYKRVFGKSFDADKIREKFYYLRKFGSKAIDMLSMLEMIENNVNAIAIDYIKNQRGKHGKKGEDFVKAFYASRDNARLNNTKQWLKRYKTYNGVVKLINNLKGVEVFVCTNRDKASCAQILGAFKISISSDHIVDRYVTENKAEQAKYVAKKFSIPIESILFIEDSEENALNISNAGIKTAFASWGYSVSDENVKNKMPVLKLETFEKDLQKILADELQYVVDENDNEIGKALINEVHAKQLLHRGSHIFIFNSKGELLLHKRPKKWTFPGLWDSSAGGHVPYGSTYEETTKKELKEELGIETQLTEVGKIIHRDHGFPCNGIVMLYAGMHDGPFEINKDEIDEIKFFDIYELLQVIKKNPGKFTPSFILAFKLYLSKMTYHVSDNNNAIKCVPVKEVHEKKLLHRASYIMLVNKQGKILLQKRANVKNYPHMWTLSASGHVDYGESYEEAALREMEEELGIKTKIKEIGTFLKKDGICNVWATLFFGRHDGPFNFNKDEVEEVRFFTPDEIRQEIEKHSKDFIISVRYALDLYEEWRKAI